MKCKHSAQHREKSIANTRLLMKNYCGFSIWFLFTELNTSISSKLYTNTLVAIKEKYEKEHYNFTNSNNYIFLFKKAR
jgi:hypothetical protein